MKKLGLTVLLVLFVSISNGGRAAGTESSDPVDGDDETQAQAEAEAEGSVGASLLALSARLDAAFGAGLATNQGFSIPSVRLAASGEINRYIAYRLAFGETREFSTALLPQILPVEAYVDFISGENNTWLKGANVTWRFGMFTPTFNPWWTPDLTYLALPDYSIAQQSLLLSRDIGTEINYEVLPGHLSFSVGVFNGNGIFSLNSNNSHAFVGSIKADFDPFPALHLTLGISGYDLAQSMPGAVNYKSVVAFDAYASLNFKRLGLIVNGDFLYGQSQDSTTNTSPRGGLVFATLELNDWAKLFTRAELMNSLPGGAAFPLKHFQLGPILELDRQVQAYLFYDYLEPGDGSSTNSGQLRLRLII